MTLKAISSSASDYALAATKISLGLLQTLSAVIPVPHLSSAIGAATQIIQIAEAVKSNVKGAATLADHVYAIMLVVITSLKGKTETDIPKDLKASLERLSKDLLSVLDDVKRVQKRMDTTQLMSLVKAIVRYGDNTSMIAGCTARLDWAMRVFHVEARIRDSLRIAEVLNKLVDVHEDVQQMHQDVKEIMVGIKNVIPRATLPSAVIPPKPELFYGRDDIVEDVSRRIVSTATPRLGLVGPGGIGKTSVAQAILEHAAVVQRFQSRLHWSRCDEATSPILLVEVIARSLGLEQPSTDRLRDVTSYLRSDTQARLLVLDNFETPCDIEGCQSEITDILCALTAIPHLAILVTMRGTLPGVGRVKWTRPEIPPLSPLTPDYARELFVEIDPKADRDASLTALLAELDHMPLAVTLMAKAGSAGETPTGLLKTWRSRGTDLLHEPGGDRRTSVNLSIELSLRSNLMKANPEALTMLSVLAVLPGAVRGETMADLVPSVSDPVRARAALLRASLVYTSDETKSFRVLAPIRSYIVHRHTPTPKLWQGLYEFSFKYLKQHPARSFREESYYTDMQALATEEATIASILSYALEHDPSAAAITAALDFGSFRSRTVRRSDPTLAMAAVTAARSIEDREHLAPCLWSLAAVFLSQNRYKDARATFEEARTEFLGLDDRKGYAECLTALSEVARVEERLVDAESLLKEASAEYQLLGSSSGSAYCLLCLGCVVSDLGRYEDARRTLEDARVAFTEIDNRYAIARCLKSLGHVARMEKRYNDALTSFEEARREFLQLEFLVDAAHCLRGLGHVARLEGRYADACNAFEGAHSEFSRLAEPSEAVDCLKWLGHVAHQQGRYEEAANAFDGARVEASRLGESSISTYCLLNLGIAHYMLEKIGEASKTLLEAQRQFVRLEDSNGAAECSKWLGNIDWKEGRYEDARHKLDSARLQFQQLEQADDVADCLRGLGDAGVAEGRYDDGRKALKEALGEFRRLDIRKGIAGCLTSLGGLELKEGHLDEGRSNLEEARGIYEELGVQDKEQVRCLALLTGINQEYVQAVHR